MSTFIQKINTLCKKYIPDEKEIVFVPKTRSDIIFVCKKTFATKTTERCKIIFDKQHATYWTMN